MKKYALITSVFVGSVVLAGCTSKSTTTTTTPTQDQTPTTAAQNSDTNKFKSWTDALKVGGGLKCTMTDTKTNTTSQYVAKGKKMHMSGIVTSNDQKATTGEMIVDESFLYTWDSTKNEGFKMAIPSEEEQKKSADQAKDAIKNAPQTPDFSSEEEIEKLENEGMKLDCNPTIVSDSEFVPPANVKFADFSVMMKNAAESAQEGMSAEEKQQFEEMMKKSAGQ